jgi:hypothetical protein
MVLQLKPNQWSCAITSLAMTLRRPVADLVEQIGHNGGEIIFPDLPEPLCRRGFHDQELIHLAWQHGYTSTAIELNPQIIPEEGGEGHRVYFGDDPRDNWARFTGTIRATMGILMGQSGRCQHAVHYRFGHIYDPDGCEYPYSVDACEDHGLYGNRLLVLSR